MGMTNQVAVVAAGAVLTAAAPNSLAQAAMPPAPPAQIIVGAPSAPPPGYYQAPQNTWTGPVQPSDPRLNTRDSALLKHAEEVGMLKAQVRSGQFEAKQDIQDLRLAQVALLRSLQDRGNPGMTPEQQMAMKQYKQASTILMNSYKYQAKHGNEKAIQALIAEQDKALAVLGKPSGASAGPGSPDAVARIAEFKAARAPLMANLNSGLVQTESARAKLPYAKDDLKRAGELHKYERDHPWARLGGNLGRSMGTREK